MAGKSAEDIFKAHQDGRLLAHMFEFSPSLPFDGAPKQFFGVMAGLDDSHFKNSYRDVCASEDGYAGLATTALKRDIPVELWTFVSNAGLLFENDNDHIKPFFASSGDAASFVTDNQFHASIKPSVCFREMVEAQGFNDRARKGKKHGADANRVIIPLDEKSEWLALIPRARRAIKLMWEKLGELPWSEYIEKQSLGTQAVNEIDVVAHLKGVKGLVVSEVSKFNNPYDISDKQSDFIRGIDYILKLRDWLRKTYGDIIPNDLPIFSYNPDHKENQLVCMSEAQLRAPGDYFLERCKGVVPHKTQGRAVGL